jgi:hypothetical protein
MARGFQSVLCVLRSLVSGARDAPGFLVFVKTVTLSQFFRAARIGETALAARPGG